MAIDRSLAARLDEIRKQPKSWKDGLRVFPRDDDVLFAAEVVDQVSTKTHPAVFDDGGYWVYDPDAGAWLQLDRVFVKRAAMGLSGSRVFVKTVKVKNDDGIEHEEMVTAPVDLRAARVNGVTDLVETILSEPGHFDMANQGVAFRNGFAVPLASGVSLRQKSPNFRARNPMDFTWAERSAPKWSAFLDSVFRDDADKDQKKLFLQEFVGTALVGGCTYFEKAAILFGGGSNGKSVFLDVVSKCFPDRNRSAIPPQNWEQEYYRARLDGVLLNVVSELPMRDIVDSPAVKAIISGETITARRPRENPFDFRPRAGQLFSVNPPMPAASDLSRGFWRRFTMVGFNRNYENDVEKNEKKVYEGELMRETQGIVYWALQGACRALKQGGYTDVPSSAAALEEWRTSSDQVAMFVRECCFPAVERSQMLTPEELYRAYRDWGDRTGHRMQVSLSRFVERLTLLGYAASVDGAQSVRPLCLITRAAVRREDDQGPEDPPRRPEQGKLFQKK